MVLDDRDADGDALEDAQRGLPGAVEDEPDGAVLVAREDQREQDEARPVPAREGLAPRRAAARARAAGHR
jgi:hypothetical protein